MTESRHLPALVLNMDAVDADLATVGDKGASLARLAGAGLPVPPGFHIVTDAYRRYVEHAGMGEGILDAVAQVDPYRLETAEDAARRIEGLFARHELSVHIAGPVRWAYAALGDRDQPVAVRSSASAVEHPDLSFTGLLETRLGVRGEAALLEAVRDCWASLWTARAIAHRVENHVDHSDVSMGVTVQSMVPAETSGVMFTVAPVSGDADQVVVHAAWGLGDALAGGRVNPDAIVLDKASGKVIGQRIAGKSVQSVLTGHGVTEEPVPPGWRARPALPPEAAAELVRLGVRIEELYGRPMNVEWARYDRHPYILQAHPITGLGELPAPDTEVWNDSLAGHALWSNAGLGEAVPDVMTPCTWSLIEMFMRAATEPSALPGHRAYGTIGGRLYMNVSVRATLATALGLRSRLDALEQIVGPLPAGMRIPLLPVSRARVVRGMLPAGAAAKRRGRRNRKRLPGFVESAPGRCDVLHERIAAASRPGELTGLWGDAVLPLFVEACRMLEAVGGQDAADLAGARRRLEELAGKHDADAMLAGLRHPRRRLAGLSPVTGLAQLSRGEIGDRTYLRDWGHRGPHEFEVSMPRPAEDPDWLDGRLAAARDVGGDAAVLLDRQLDASRAAWRRFRARHPRQVTAARRQAGRYARTAYAREGARSEVVRALWVVRAFVLRAGELTGHGDKLFFLSIDEIMGVLDRDERPLRRVPARRRTYERYRTLPPYPTLIRGGFDPFVWAADPDRRTRMYDGTGEEAGTREEGRRRKDGGKPVAAPRKAPTGQAPTGQAPTGQAPTGQAPAVQEAAGVGATPVGKWRRSGEAGETVTGSPGSSGVVEGEVRVLSSPEEGDRLRPDEVLVAVVANIGWTPLFPHAAAVVTDVGAPLSHAAIVARELGVPAVMGCGDATARLRTGDRVRVDGGRGRIEIIGDRRRPTEASPHPTASGSARRTAGG